MAKELKPNPYGLKHYKYQVQCRMGSVCYSTVARHTEQATKEVTAYFHGDPHFQITALDTFMRYQEKESIHDVYAP